MEKKGGAGVLLGCQRHGKMLATERLLGSRRMVASLRCVNFGQRWTTSRGRLSQGKGLGGVCAERVGAEKGVGGGTFR